jgi:iron(II)-dependent oxidoreductase
MTKPVPTERLAAMMTEARQRTHELLDGLSAEQLIGPKLPIVNPMQWEIGHVAWFHEFFILRRIYERAPILANGDSLYDSIAIEHDVRWDLPLLPMRETLDYMDKVLNALVDRLGDGEAGETDSFLYQFTTFHEDMHTEAYTWTRQTLGYPTPRFRGGPDRAKANGGTGPIAGDAEVPGGVFLMGSPPGAPFLFDNEKWAHPVTVEPFRMARAPVTTAEFAAFVGDGGYANRDLWDADGWAWREAAEAEHPVYWVPDGPGKWGVRRFDEVYPLAPDEPIVHVNWYEAGAYCRWAGRRLPTEAEWELAATTTPESPRGLLVKRRYPWGDDPPDAGHTNLDGYRLGCADVAAYPDGDSAYGCRQMIGNVWEWTGDTFGPFAGFSPDAYKEYSRMLFGDTKVLRGGAWMSRSRMVTPTYRNYFGPERRDVFAGFRTCAAE